ncbi:MAG: hypothetical protein AB7P07_02250 [Hyphomonadaceae bacterium]
MKYMSVAAFSASLLIASVAAAQEAETAPAPAPAPAAEAPAPPAEAQAASASAVQIGPPLPVEMRRTRGGANVLAAMPRIALAGYNIGAFMTTRVSARSGGSLLGNSMGARARMDFSLVGVDQTLLQRIADAAHADLVAQLEAAGYEVSGAREVFADGRGANMLAGGGTYEGEEPGTQSEMLVAGPSGVGAVAYQGVGRLAVGGGGGMGAISHGLNAILVFPNLALDFAETSGSGNRSFGNRANVEGEARFGIDPMSKAEVFFSRSGRGFFDGWGTLQVTEATTVADEFASTEQTSQRSNTGMGVASAILGAGMQHSRRSGYEVTADPAAYEALALRAARGFNAALVAQIRAARGG